jgi:hypothetical protein
MAGLPKSVKKNWGAKEGAPTQLTAVTKAAQLALDDPEIDPFAILAKLGSAESLEDPLIKRIMQQIDALPSADKRLDRLMNLLNLRVKAAEYLVPYKYAKQVAAGSQSALDGAPSGGGNVNVLVVDPRAFEQNAPGGVKQVFSASSS